MDRQPERTAPRIPMKYVHWARCRHIVVVAGANQALKYWTRIRRGLGTERRPFRGTQSIDAAIALASLGGDDSRTFYAWGYGAAVDPSRTYFYAHATGSVHRLRFLSRAFAADIFNYSEGSARRGARQLVRDIASSRALDPEQVIFVGCSWGAAVLDYAATHAPDALCGPAVAIGGPRALPSWRRPWPRMCPLSPDGDHGTLWVQRHPDDPIGAAGIRPLFYPAGRRFHDYRSILRPDPERPQFWGITG
jgi:hypothetical protein